MIQQKSLAEGSSLWHKPQIKKEFLTQSAISVELFQAATTLLPDIEFDHLTKEVVSTPLYDALNWKYTRFTHSVKPDLLGVGFLTESGDIWQVKVFGSKDSKRSGKYYAPKGIGDCPYLPPIPDTIRQKIAEKYNVSPPDESESFWAWLTEHKEIPLVITEGGKKALSALSAAIPTISLYGCRCGAKTKNKESGNLIPLTLIPELYNLVCGRTIYIAFDQDTKPKAKRSVERGISLLGAALDRAGAIPFVAEWNRQLGKGVDDVIAAYGEKAFEQILSRSTSYQGWKLKHLTDLTDWVSHQVCSQFFPSELVVPDGAQLIGIKSAKGTGKTEWLTKIVGEAQSTGIKALVMTHRIQLARHLCARFGIDHIDTVRNSETQGVFGYGLCIDSLHPNSKARFNPDDWQGALVILDEAEQVIWHMLNSSTCQKQRVAILENFQQLLKTVIATGGKILVSDADLSPITLTYIQKLIGEPIHTWVVENTYNPLLGKRTLYNYQHPGQLLSAILEHLAAGKRLVIHTSSQQKKFPFSTTNLEKIISQQNPHLRIIRIDRATVSNPEHPAFSCMENLNHVLKNYDVVIASPTIETGVSIEVDCFDAVFSFALGVQTVDAVCQTLERVRAHIPRHLFAKTFSPHQISSGATSVKDILRRQNKKYAANLALLSQADAIAAIDDESPEHLLTWAKRAAIVNVGAIKYRESILAKLSLEGYEVNDVDLDIQSAKDTKKVAQDCATQNSSLHRQEVCSVETPSPAKYEELKSKNLKTAPERLQEQKGDIARRYLTSDITEELVERDDSGWYKKLLLHFYFTLGREFLCHRDSRTLSEIASDGGGKVFKPDVNQRMLSASIRALEIIGIEQFLDPTKTFTSDAIMDWLNRLLPWRNDIQAILGVGIGQNGESPISVAQRLLALFGLKMTCLGQRKNASGQRVRVYQGCSAAPDNRAEVFQRWFQRDSEIYATGEHTPSNKSNLQGVCV